jgi:hypothetical protein
VVQNSNNICVKNIVNELFVFNLGQVKNCASNPGFTLSFNQVITGIRKLINIEIFC